MKKSIEDFREVFDRAILRSLEAVHARALGYDYEEVWAMGGYLRPGGIARGRN